MSGLDRIKEKMKSKLNDGNLLEKNGQETGSGRKIYTLSKEDNLMLKKIFSNRLNLENATAISKLMSEAIKLLYDKEFSD